MTDKAETYNMDDFDGDFKVGSKDDLKKNLIQKLKSMRNYPTRFALVPAKLFESVREMKEVADAGYGYIGIVAMEEVGAKVTLHDTVVFAGNKQALKVGLKDAAKEIKAAGYQMIFMPQR